MSSVSTSAVSTIAAVYAASGSTSIQADVKQACSTPVGGIHKIDCIAKLATLLSGANSKSTFVLFDIDETMVRSLSELGAEWRRIVSKVAPDLHDSLTHFVAKKVPMTPMESHTVLFINSLKKLGYAVGALTARQRAVWYKTSTPDVDQLTVNQLKSIGISFDDTDLKSRYPALTNQPTYFEGIFFADIEKGAYLKQILTGTFEKPKEIVVIDDKRPLVESINFILNQLKMDHTCVWYDPPVEEFRPLIAYTQLKGLLEQGQFISNEEAEKMARSISGDPKTLLETQLKAIDITKLTP